jgi:hypothetical protein
MPSFAPFSAAQVDRCASFWRGNMEWVYARATYYQAKPASVLDNLQLYDDAKLSISDLKQFVDKQASCASQLTTCTLLLLFTLIYCIH